MGHGAMSDDLFLAVVRYAPFVFVVVGLLTVAWLASHPSVAELQPNVLAALSETEALSAADICRRLPFDNQRLDTKLLAQVLDELCGAGLAVRWYQTNGQPVYRRVRRNVVPAK